MYPLEWLKFFNKMHYMHIHNEMITTIELINIICLLTWVLFLVCVVKVPEIHSLSKVWVSNTVLPTLFIMLYINSLDLLILHEFNVILFDQYLTLSHPTQPLGSTILFPSTMYLICLDYNCILYEFFKFMLWLQLHTNYLNQNLFCIFLNKLHLWIAS